MQTSNYEIKQFIPCHLMEMDGLTPQMTYQRAMLYWENARDDGLALSGFYRGQLIGSCGVIVNWRGYGTIWIALKSGAEEHAVFIYRSIKRRIEEIAKVLNLQRLDATVLADQEKDIRLIEHLGFRPEGVLKKYFMGRNYILYARYFED